MIRWAIDRPVSVIVACILLVMFGLIALTQVPVQLTPTVDRPNVTVTTAWPGRSPEEVVDAVTREQEKKLKNVANLRSMRSVSSEGQAEITLEFNLGADISRALQEVSDALRQVPEYPEEVDEPAIKAAEGSALSPIAWIILDVSEEGIRQRPGFDVSGLFDAVDKEVRPALERIDGVAEINIYGGRERQVQVKIDPVKLAQRGLNPLDVIAALRNENRNTSAGGIDEGKYEVRVRVLGQFLSVQELLETVIAFRAPVTDAGAQSAAAGPPRPVYLKDVATAELSVEKRRSFVRSSANDCLAINVIRQSGANTIQIMEQLRTRLDEVRADVLPRLDPEIGSHLVIEQVYDETIYINAAIDLVQENLWQGGLLASLVLLIFLRSLVSTGIVAVAIPLSVIGSFSVMYLTGRSLNVVSLAGLAFSVGMGIDNAIVVLENIDRRRRLGDPPFQAAYRGAKEVWSAIFASTLTNVAVFLPIITMQQEAGQLFRDITIAATASVFISLIVAITVIPSAAARSIGVHPTARPRGRLRAAWEDLFGLARLAVRGAAGFSAFIRWLITGWRAHTLRPLVIVAMTLASLLGALRLMPPLDYLPAGNQNLVFGFLLIPPGYSIDQQRQVGERVEQVVMPYLRADINKPETVRALPPVFNMADPARPFDPVPVQDFFVVGFNGGMFAGASSQDPERVIPVGALLSGAMNTSPGAFGIAQQTSIFGQGVIGGGNTVNIELSGPNLDDVLEAARRIRMLTFQHMDTLGFVRPDPSNFDLGQPELRVRVNRFGRELGLTPSAIGTAVRSLFDGAFVDDFRLGADTVEMVLLPAGGRLARKEDLAQIPIATPAGRVVPLDSVIEASPNYSPQSIQRIEELPSVTFIATPPKGRPLEEFMAELDRLLIEPLRAEGLINPGMRVRMEGTAAELSKVTQALFGERAAPRDGGRTPLARAGRIVAGIVLGAGLAGVVWCGLRMLRPRSAGTDRRAFGQLAYAAVGLALMSLLLAGLTLTIATQPHLIGARFIWALTVTYLLMCALYESFIYPLVIMFSVPLAVVGGFAGLRMVHALTLADPTKAPQQLDVLTMLGFLILIGIVVNNAILLVEQALNLMHPQRIGDAAAGERPLPAIDAIFESVRTRMRPIFMSTLTSVFGTLPLAVAPGAGSEMYRGIGAVLIGGQLVSTLFTLVLVPLVFSLTMQMTESVRSLGRGGPARA